jgi:hypothetical protein
LRKHGGTRKLKYFFLIVFWLLSSNSVAAMDPSCVLVSREKLVKDTYSGADKIFFGWSVSNEVTQKYVYSNANGETFDRVNFKITYEAIFPLKGMLPFSKIDIHYNTLQEQHAETIALKEGMSWLSARRYSDGLYREFRGGGFCNKGASNVELISYSIIILLKYSLAVIFGTSVLWLGYIILRQKVNGRQH